MTDQIPPTPQPAQTPPPQAEPMPPSPMQGAPESDEKFFAALGYFAFLFVVPLIVKPKSAYCKFHARQSMVLFLVAIVVLVVLAAIPWFGSLLTLALFAVYILAIYRSYMGDLWNIPLISNFAGKLNVDTLYGKAGLAMGGISGLKEKAQGFASKASEGVKNLGKQEEGPTSQPPAPQGPTTPPPTQ